jgi:hypothetical protein
MTEQGKIEATWQIELNCDCPSCKKYVNLIDTPDFWDGCNLDIGEHDTENSNGVEVLCPECGYEFTVCCVY